MPPKIKPKFSLTLAIDSGAHGLWGKHLAAKTSEGVKMTGKAAWEGADYSFLSTKAFAQYFEDYIDFVKARGKHLEFYVALDIINNPTESRRMYRAMLKANTNPLPVYHYGEDESVLQEYLSHTDYVGYTGPHHIGQETGYVEHSDRIWKKYFLDSAGKPKIKVHGFAVTRPSYVTRWPWYSVDSTSAFTQARTGSCLYPRVNREGLDYTQSPITICHTERRGEAAQHFERLPGLVREAINAHLDKVGVTLEEVSTSYQARDKVNIYFADQQCKAINKQWEERFGIKHWLHYYASGNASAGPATVVPTLKYLAERGQLTHTCYLGTFFTGQRAPMEHVMQALHGVGFTGCARKKKAMPRVRSLDEAFQEEVNE